MMEIKMIINVETPSTPNFIKLLGTDTTISVKEFSEDQLRQIAESWARDLILKATSRQVKLYLRYRTDSEIIDDYLKGRNLCSVCNGPYNCGSDHK